MDIIIFLSELGHSIRPWLDDISTAIVACLLVVFGGDINRLLRRRLSKYNFIIRTLAFILVNAFGYGLLIVYLSPLLHRELLNIPNYLSISIITATFIFIGCWAQRNKQA
ncbi:membrane protein [Photobacterium leiognathi subsp. mandapamensis]|nr:membrane protein [Photobacterium leiognathi subsp. mandapamensis]